MNVADPLTLLPTEIVLRILEFCPVSAIAALTAVSKSWHGFIDYSHQETIFSDESKTAQPLGGSRDFSYLDDIASFAKLFEGVSSWKDLCKRQTLLARNWAESNPVSRESVLQVGNDPVWRFRADFKRRFFVSTSQAGGLNVTDMDTGRIIWRLPSTMDRDEEAVRPFAHLEYQDGMAVFDREGDAVEVWQADVDDAPRGEFRRIAILNHNCMTRGFQLSHSTLCVVSNQGQGFVYDMTQRPPKLTTTVKIERGAVGHLDQSKDVVIYSMGAKGYHAHEKSTGAFLGVLHPSHCTEKYHIRPPAARSTTSATAALAGVARHGPTHRLFPPGAPRKDCLVPIKLEKGPLPPPSDPNHVWHTEDEWGAGMINGDLFAGFSRAGRVFVCSDWRKALRDQASLAANSTLLECESDGSHFDLGGWLSVRNHRVMFEIQDRIYVVALDDKNKVHEEDPPARASYSLLTSSAPQLAVPVSFMALYDDAIMTTYTTLGWRQNIPNVPGDLHPPLQGAARIFPTKAIRIVSLAPDLSSDGPIEAESAEPPQPQDPDPQSEEHWRSQAALLQLVTMLGDDFGEEEDSEEDHDEDHLGVFADAGDDDDSDGGDEDHGHDHGHGHGHGHEHEHEHEH